MGRIVALCYLGRVVACDELSLGTNCCFLQLVTNCRVTPCTKCDSIVPVSMLLFLFLCRTVVWQDKCTVLSNDKLLFPFLFIIDWSVVSTKRIQRAISQFWRIVACDELSHGTICRVTSSQIFQCLNYLDVSLQFSAQSSLNQAAIIGRVVFQVSHCR